MNLSIIVFLIIIAQCCANIQEYGTGQRKYKVSNLTNLERQRDILRLFNHINNRQSLYEDHSKISTEYSIENSANLYDTDVEAFVKLYKKSMLLQFDDIFSIYNKEHLQQAILLFKLFYYSQDYETFYKTAVWARNHLNFGLFSYAFSVALVHRNDTYTLILPLIDEINPYYFVEEYMIKKARQLHEETKDGVIFPQLMNSKSKESMLNYYLQDVGLNSFYYYCNVYYPFWMDGEEFGLKNDRRGEQFYYLYQQLLARFRLELLSNDVSLDIDLINYDLPLNKGFYPNLIYPNDAKFPDRTKDVAVNRRSHDYFKIMDVERRLRDSVDGGFIFKKDGTLQEITTKDMTNLLGNLIESNPDSLNANYYGSIPYFSRQIMNFSQVPSALHHFETALRDPIFYQLYQKLVAIIQDYKEKLPAYSSNDLSFPGVEIEKMEFDKELITHFDTYDSDLTNIFGDTNLEIKLRSLRLNHVPFTYNIFVKSDREVEAVVRIYLGPKTVNNLNENRMNFVEIDTFTHKLQAGDNIIERSSRQPYWYVPDRTTFKELYRRIVKAVENTEELVLDSSEAFYGLPNRLLLPKGKTQGQLFQFFVIINEYKEPKRQSAEQDFYFLKVGTGMNFVDDFAFGFPFDRSIKEEEFNVSNSIFQDVIIYHKNTTN